MEISSGISGVLKDPNVELPTKCTVCINTLKLPDASKSHLVVVQWLTNRISSKLSKEDQLDNLKNLWIAFHNVAMNKPREFEEAFNLSCNNIPDFFLRVSNDISASIPSIEEFILQVLLLGDDSEAQTLRKVRRALQSQPRAVNQILANVLDKGNLWRQKRKEVAVKYRNYLRNIGEAADSDSFVTSLLKNFATELQIGTDGAADEVIGRAVFAGSDNRSSWSTFFKSLVTQDCKPPNECKIIQKVLTEVTSRDVLAAVTRSSLTAVVGGGINGAINKKLLKDSALMLMIAAKSLNVATGIQDGEVILSDSLALSQLPRFAPDPSADLASFGKILSAVPAQLIDYEVQNPEGQKCSVATWLRQVILALVKDPAYHNDEILSILSSAVDISPTFLSPIVGQVASTVMFGNFSTSGSRDFVRKLLACHIRMRQVPKLVAKIFISLQQDPETKYTVDSSVNEEILREFGQIVPQLPSAQLLETWKTFIYHLKSGDNRIRKFCDLLMPQFINHGSFVEHSLPLSFVEKVVNFMDQTECQDVPNIERSMGQLSELLKLYREGQVKLNSEVKSNKRPAPKAEETLPTKKLKNFYALTSDEVEENPQLQKELIGHFVENMSVPGGDKHVKKIKSLIAENFSKIDESPSEYEAVLKDVYKHVLKSLSNKSFDPVVPQEVLQVLGLLPIEQIRGHLESTLSALLMASRNFPLLARCWDQTFRSTNTLKYVLLGDILPLLTSLEDSGELKASRLLTRTCVSFMKPLTELEPFLENFNELLAAGDKVSAASPTLIIEALEKPLTSNADISEEKISLCKRFFEALTKSMLKSMKKDSHEMSDLGIRGLGSFLNVKLATMEESAELDKKALGVKILKKYILKATVDFQASDIKFLRAVTDGYPILCKFKELADHSVFIKVWKRSVEMHCHQIMNSLVTKADTELLSQILDEGAECGPLNVDTVTVLVKASIPSENAAKSDLRRKAVQNAIVRLYSDHSSLDKVDSILSLCHLQQSLFETDRPLMTSHAESFLLKKLPQTRDILSMHGEKEFCRVWQAIHAVFSAMMHKRFGFVVKTRAHHAFSLLRNLYEGLVMAGDQNRKVQDLSQLVTLSHYWDRSTDHVRNMKDDFFRIVPYFVADVLDGFQRVTVLPAVKSNLQSGLHKLLDLCDKHSIDYLVGVLPTGRKEIFKDIVATYKTYHKYSGKI